MSRRTTIEIDEGLMARAMKALGSRTMRETVEEALRLAAESGEARRAHVAEEQARYFTRLEERTDREVLRSEQMWR